MMQEQKASLSVNSKMVDLECDKHGKFQAKAFLVGDKWTNPICKQCKEELYKKWDEQEKERKEREELQARASAIRMNKKNSGIPLRFENRAFENFATDTQFRQEKYDCAKSYADNFKEVLEKGSCLIFCGNTGTGKTHLACSIANQVLDDARSVLFVSTLKAVRAVKETYSKKEKTEQEAINDFIRPDLLILDEVGVQFGSDAEKNIIFEIINERYEAIKPTILISNLNVSGLVDFIGERVIDRLKENNGQILKFDARSYRGA